MSMLDRVVWDGTFGGRFGDRDHAIGVFERHNEEVKRSVPADRLLVYEVKDGWRPLCEFLGVPVPEDKPFPHLNDTEEFRARIRRTALAVRAVAYPVVVAVALALGWVVMRLIS
jgi:hypothetical protein